MNVLNLVTNPDAQFFEQQVETLAGLGVSSDVVAVPGDRRTTDDTAEPRSVLDWLQFYPQVLRASRGDYDVVHANYGLTAPAALAQPRRPVVLSLWGSDLLGSVGWVSRLCARAADAVIVMSEEMAAALDPIDSHVIPHGVDMERFQPLSRRVARDRVGWDGDAAQVLFPYAERRAVKDYPRAEAVVAAAREQFDGDIELRTLHGVAHDRMPLYMNAADALLLTSKSEGSPNSVKEAMACNCPVVATAVGDVPALLSDVTASHVCRTDEELVAGLIDVLERGERSDGRAHVEPYGLDRMGKRILDVYESVQ
ncbi:glycosyltransferase [Halodesulfurarchaeum formicicum]|uniref:Glycosyl transferase family 1 n=1 Tax=Halodesulfurarchaeum formicicum TaxID=1873524 RepID=A0A1J1AB56_9EURY|nr:glycosyltransferase [Halodesulfurarchaeum formicicum]APE95109.1 glycosyl transferase family 1 [Halodesulfurarchaeum formicicum]